MLEYTGDDEVAVEAGAGEREDSDEDRVFQIYVDRRQYRSSELFKVRSTLHQALSPPAKQYTANRLPIIIVLKK